LAVATISTCLSLCAIVTKIKCIQEQAQWDAPSPKDPTILALWATIMKQNSILLDQQQALEALTAHTTHCPNLHFKSDNNDD